MKTLWLIIAIIIAAAFAGLTFSATVEDGILRAISVALLAGVVGLMGSLFVFKMVSGWEE